MREGCRTDVPNVDESRDPRLLQAVRLFLRKLLESQPQFADEDVVVIPFPSPGNSPPSSPHMSIAHEEQLLNESLSNWHSQHQHRVSSSSNNNNNEEERMPPLQHQQFLPPSFALPSVEDESNLSHSQPVSSSTLPPPQLGGCFNQDEREKDTTTNGFALSQSLEMTPRRRARDSGGEDEQPLADASRSSATMARHTEPTMLGTQPQQARSSAGGSNLVSLLAAVSSFDAKGITRNRKTALEALKIVWLAYTIGWQDTQFEVNFPASQRARSYTEQSSPLRKAQRFEDARLSQSSLPAERNTADPPAVQRELFALPLSRAPAPQRKPEDVLLYNLDKCIQSLLVYCNESYSLRQMVISSTSLLELFNLVCKEGRDSEVLRRGNVRALVPHSRSRDVLAELENLLSLWRYNGVREVSITAMQESYLLEFLLDVALPPAVCSSRYDGIASAIREKKQRIVSDLVNGKIAVSSLVRGMSIRSLASLINLGAYAEPRLRVKLYDKVAADGYLIATVRSAIESAVVSMAPPVPQGKARRGRGRPPKRRNRNSTCGRPSQSDAPLQLSPQPKEPRFSHLDDPFSQSSVERHSHGKVSLSQSPELSIPTGNNSQENDLNPHDDRVNVSGVLEGDTAAAASSRDLGRVLDILGDVAFPNYASDQGTASTAVADGTLPISPQSPPSSQGRKVIRATAWASSIPDVCAVVDGLLKVLTISDRVCPAVRALQEKIRSVISYMSEFSVSLFSSVVETVTKHMKEWTPSSDIAPLLPLLMDLIQRVPSATDLATTSTASGTASADTDISQMPPLFPNTPSIASPTVPLSQVNWLLAENEGHRKNAVRAMGGWLSIISSHAVPDVFEPPSVTTGRRSAARWGTQQQRVVNANVRTSEPQPEITAAAMASIPCMTRGLTRSEAARMSPFMTFTTRLMEETTWRFGGDEFLLRMGVISKHVIIMQRRRQNLLFGQAAACFGSLASLLEAAEAAEAAAAAASADVAFSDLPTRVLVEEGGDYDREELSASSSPPNVLSGSNARIGSLTPHMHSNEVDATHHHNHHDHRVMEDESDSPHDSLTFHDAVSSPSTLSPVSATTGRSSTGDEEPSPSAIAAPWRERLSLSFLFRSSPSGKESEQRGGIGEGAEASDSPVQSFSSSSATQR